MFSGRLLALWVAKSKKLARDRRTKVPSLEPARRKRQKSCISTTEKCCDDLVVDIDEHARRHEAKARKLMKAKQQLWHFHVRVQQTVAGQVQQSAGEANLTKSNGRGRHRHQ